MATSVISRTRSELALAEQASVNPFFESEWIDVVLLLSLGVSPACCRQAGLQRVKARAAYFHARALTGEADGSKPADAKETAPD
jgi:hypothetical protein